MNILLMKMNSPADEIIPPISLGYLASTIRKKHNVKILDCLKENLTIEQVEKYAKDYQVVGITLFTKDYPFVKNILKILKRQTQI